MSIQLRAPPPEAAVGGSSCAIQVSPPIPSGLSQHHTRYLKCTKSRCHFLKVNAHGYQIRSKARGPAAAAAAAALVWGVRFGIYVEILQPEGREARSSLPLRKRLRQLRATFSPTRGQSRDLSHAARASDLLLGHPTKLCQRRLASVIGRSQQFDKMATADLSLRDLSYSS